MFREPGNANEEKGARLEGEVLDMLLNYVKENLNNDNLKKWVELYQEGIKKDHTNLGDVLNVVKGLIDPKFKLISEDKAKEIERSIGILEKAKSGPKELFELACLRQIRVLSGKSTTAHKWEMSPDPGDSPERQKRMAAAPPSLSASEDKNVLEKAEELVLKREKSAGYGFIPATAKTSSTEIYTRPPGNSPDSVTASAGLSDKSEDELKNELREKILNKINSALFSGSKVLNVTPARIPGLSDANLGQLQQIDTIIYLENTSLNKENAPPERLTVAYFNDIIDKILNPANMQNTYGSAVESERGTLQPRGSNPYHAMPAPGNYDSLPSGPPDNYTIAPPPLPENYAKVPGSAIHSDSSTEYAAPKLRGKDEPHAAVYDKVAAFDTYDFEDLKVYDKVPSGDKAQKKAVLDAIRNLKPDDVISLTNIANVLDVFQRQKRLPGLSDKVKQVWLRLGDEKKEQVKNELKNINEKLLAKIQNFESKQAKAEVSKLSVAGSAATESNYGRLPRSPGEAKPASVYDAPPSEGGSPPTYDTVSPVRNQYDSVSAPLQPGANNVYDNIKVPSGDSGANYVELPSELMESKLKNEIVDAINSVKPGENDMDIEVLADAIKGLSDASLEQLGQIKETVEKDKQSTRSELVKKVEEMLPQESSPRPGR